KKAMRMNGKSEERFGERIDQLKQNIIKVRNKSFLSLFSLNQTLFSQSTQQEEEQQRHKTILDLFRTPKLRKYSISLCFIYPAITLVYYGISYNIGNFGGNFLVSFTLGGNKELFNSRFHY